MPGPPRLPVAVGEPGGRVIASAVSLLWPVPPAVPPPGRLHYLRAQGGLPSVSPPRQPGSGVPRRGAAGRGAPAG